MTLRSIIATGSVVTCVLAQESFGQYEAPASYYSSITTQTGTALKSQLTAIMSSGHVQTSYEQVRDYLPFTDANPDNLAQMFEFYTHNVVQKPSATSMGFTGLYQSREHVWPDSLQGPGNTSNSTRGSRGDIHMLKPLSQSVNSSRGNNAFGGAALSGAPRNIGGSLWFPGSSDRGDAARIIFYGATRWSSTLSVVNGTPTSNTQMGDLASLLRFHYLETPDLFERRRNDTIYRGDDVRTSNDDSPFTGTNNRNAFIDRPEYVWSVFVDQQNDTQLSVGTTSTDGGSTAVVELGRVLRGASVPAARQITLSKTGVDGTYYSVTASGDATSSVNGRYNAFAMDTTGSQSIAVGLNSSTAVAGRRTGAVTIDNLDVTTAGGVGRGANDANDQIDIRLDVLDAARPSFDPATLVNSAVIDFGTYAQGATTSPIPVSLHNLSSSLGADLTADLDLDAIHANGDVDAFDTTFATFTAMPAGDTANYVIDLDSATRGRFEANFDFSLSDEDLPGTQTVSALSISAIGRIALAGDTNYDDEVDFSDLLVTAQHYGLGDSATWELGDFDRDQMVSFDDLLALAQHYAATPAGFESDWALARAMTPEPGSLLISLPFALLRRRRR